MLGIDPQHAAEEATQISTILVSTASARDGIGGIEGCGVALPNAAHVLGGGGEDCRGNECNQSDQEGVLHHVLATLIAPKGMTTLGHFSTMAKVNYRATRGTRYLLVYRDQAERRMMPAMRMAISSDCS